MVLLGKKIKELRTKSKFTQSELANLLGVTKSSVLPMKTIPDSYLFLF